MKKNRTEHKLSIKEILLTLLAFSLVASLGIFIKDYLLDQTEKTDSFTVSLDSQNKKITSTIFGDNQYIEKNTQTEVLGVASGNGCSNPLSISPARSISDGVKMLCSESSSETNMTDEAAAFYNAYPGINQPAKISKNCEIKIKKITAPIAYAGISGSGSKAQAPVKICDDDGDCQYFAKFGSISGNPFYTGNYPPNFSFGLDINALGDDESFGIKVMPKYVSSEEGTEAQSTNVEDTVTFIPNESYCQSDEFNKCINQNPEKDNYFQKLYGQSVIAPVSIENSAVLRDNEGECNPFKVEEQELLVVPCGKTVTTFNSVNSSASEVILSKVFNVADCILTGSCGTNTVYGIEISALTGSNYSIAGNTGGDFGADIQRAILLSPNDVNDILQSDISSKEDSKVQDAPVKDPYFVTECQIVACGETINTNCFYNASFLASHYYDTTSFMSPEQEPGSFSTMTYDEYMDAICDYYDCERIKN